MSVLVKCHYVIVDSHSQLRQNLCTSVPKLSLRSLKIHFITMIRRHLQPVFKVAPSFKDMKINGTILNSGVQSCPKMNKIIGVSELPF